jgi:hypothetical protein
VSLDFCNHNQSTKPNIPKTWNSFIHKIFQESKQGSFTWKPEKLRKVIHCKNRILQYNYINIQLSHKEVLRTSFNVPLRHEFLGIRSLSVGVPSSPAQPFLPAHKIWSYVHVKRLLGDQKKWKSQNAKSSKHGGFKSWICFTVWHAVWCRALLCCRQKPEDKKITAILFELLA